jgi:hypothetical protein
METREIVFLHKHLNVHFVEFAGTREYSFVACGPECELAMDCLFASTHLYLKITAFLIVPALLYYDVTIHMTLKRFVYYDC